MVSSPVIDAVSTSYMNLTFEACATLYQDFIAESDGMYIIRNFRIRKYFYLTAWQIVYINQSGKG